MSATLPTALFSGHEPTGTEFLQVVNALSRITNISNFWSTSCTLSTTSATYVDITNFSMSYTKNGGATDSTLVYIFGFGWRTSVAPTAAEFAVQCNGVDLQLVHFEITSTANAHFQNIGFGTQTGVPAGAYTIKGRAKRTAGTGTITSDSQDPGMLLVSELPL